MYYCEYKQKVKMGKARERCWLDYLDLARCFCLPSSKLAMVYQCIGCDSYHLQHIGKRIEDGKTYVGWMILLFPVFKNV